MPDGFLLVDKPPGISSFRVVGRVRALTGIKRVGHAGTLDPFASGLLILAMGRDYTRQIQSFQDLPKVYSACMVLGVETDTLDHEGTILSTDDTFSISTKDEIRDRLESVLSQFKGDLQQFPPAFSAKKVKGVRLYKLARKGIEIEVKAHAIHIYELRIDQIIVGQTPLAWFTVWCSKGTYVRQLAKDLAIAIGTVGHLTALRRVSSGSYSCDQAIEYASLTPELIESKCFYECP